MTLGSNMVEKQKDNERNRLKLRQLVSRKSAGLPHKTRSDLQSAIDYMPQYGIRAFLELLKADAEDPEELAKEPIIR